MEPCYSCRVPDSLVIVPLANKLEQISVGGKNIRRDSISSEVMKIIALRITKFQDFKIIL